MTVEEIVYHKVKDAIIHRQLAPGQQLVESTISEQLKISRSPIRNALKHLADEGFVNLVKNKGAFVSNPTREEMLQAYDLRKELEKMAAVRAMYHLTEKDFLILTDIVEEEKKVLGKNDLVGYTETNKKFHMYIASRSGNYFLPEFIEKLINQTNIYVILFDSFFIEEAYQPLGTKGHLNIIRLLKNRQPDLLREEIDKHFSDAMDSTSQQPSSYKSLDSIFRQ
ncbi:GntR family transcriptional regulator [Virgibacillus sp. YIM 98842]|uniref:GntR family transcriptional regulator n=1 Tax=Virgibacillus sp. YIM 98842 TaxID=2663533 RepID=UPI001F09E759|nr:GntR family transcriptional regulator [Virgibacillus sp. YIM 98842]